MWNAGIVVTDISGWGSNCLVFPNTQTKVDSDVHVTSGTEDGPVEVVPTLTLSFVRVVPNGAGITCVVVS